MSRICISNCVNDARVSVRPNYVNLYKWPESDAEFIGGGRLQGRVADSRQMYLRSYTFSRKETIPERTIKCLGKVRDRVVAAGRKQKPHRRRPRRRRRCRLARRVKDFSRSVLLAIFRRLLFCTTTLDVAGGGGGV